MQREAGRQRRRNADSDESGSEDEQQQTQQQPVQTATTTVPETASGVTAPAPPARARAKAPAAAAVTAPSMSLHADPAAAAAAAAAKAASEKSGEDEGEEEAEDAVEKADGAAEAGGEDGVDDDVSSENSIDAAAAAASRALAAEMEAIDYDTLAYAALLDIMARASRPAIEEMMAQREQQVETNVQQQQNQRVERFLDVAASSAAAANAEDEEEESAATDGYRYNAMLTRLFEALNRNNEGSAMTERNQLPVPILERMGKKKTVIANFGRICDAFHRPMEDVKDFIEKELSIRGNLDSNNALILKFEIRKQTDFDRVLIKYLDEYVKCNSCHRIDTTLTKDGRRLELRCNVCTATRTVTAAGTATFSAQIEKRSRQRAAMTL